ncbi:hypothetical protein Ga0466249_002654 [Sporomusaceae bacterium BoRhaA]|nr:hypothetical protein [Pelorhabdus rhamnosifermentans]MBU2701538.1 hypothetical protein [Pelorhabdus rhamnosifermentans]
MDIIKDILEKSNFVMNLYSTKNKFTQQLKELNTSELKPDRLRPL